MPDPLKDEETENRTHSLCLYGNPAITNLSHRRCENCPGSARTPDFHHKRCPLDLQGDAPNLFLSTVGVAAVTGKDEVTVDPKLLASSSKTSAQHDEADAVLDNISSHIADISLDGSTAPRKSGRHSRIHSSKTDRSVSVPHLEIGIKRKADQPENSLRNELADVYGGSSEIAGCMHKHQKLQDPRDLTEPLVEDNDCLESSIARRDIGADMIMNQPESSAYTRAAELCLFKDGSEDVKEHLKNKEEKIFQDLQPENELNFVHATLRSSLNIPVALDAINLIVGKQVQEYHPTGNMSICVPGIEMLMGRLGVRTCHDGLPGRNDPEEQNLLEIDLGYDDRIEAADFFPL